MANYHVSGNRKNGYTIKKENNVKASVHLDTKKEAEVKAKDLANRSGGGEVKFHGPDGRITDSDTVKPAKDPFLPRALVK